MKIRWAPRRFLFITLAIAALAIAFVAGMLSHARHWPPTVALQRLRYQLQSAGLWPTQDPQIQTDASWRQSHTCPPPSRGTMVVLVIGQSQVANSVGERFSGGPAVVNVLGGRCYEATDPLLGTTYDYGNVWTFIARELVARNMFDNVVLIMGAVGGSAISEWTPAGRLHDHLLQRLADVPPGLSVTHVIVQQGEADLVSGTRRERYQEDLTRTIRTLRRQGIAAPVFVAIESGYCGGTFPGPDRPNPVVLAQRDVITQEPAVAAGPDMDSLLAQRIDRYDGCHMSGTGARKLGEAWISILGKNAATAPQSDRDSRPP